MEMFVKMVNLSGEHEKNCKNYAVENKKAKKCNNNNKNKTKKSSYIVRKMSVFFYNVSVNRYSSLVQ